MRRRLATVAKRLTDLTLAMVGLLILAPALTIIGLLVRADSAGPAIFRQVRVGRDGRPFEIHKFRTLQVDAGGPLISASGDRRVTRIGAVLRRTKLDELPQLWDVLRGDMSLVGPRPEVPSCAALWPAAEREVILSVRPGITDPVSLLYRNEADELALATDPDQHYRTAILPRKARMYVEYVRTRSLTGDLAILVRTMVALLRR